MKQMQNLFDRVPVVSEHITTENEGELSVIAFPRFRSAFMQKYFVPRHKSPYIRIRLDAHGSSVWALIDGKRTAQEICEALSAHFEQEEGYEYRVAAFLAQLQAQGLIRFLS
jgi:hypothetical protein